MLSLLASQIRRSSWVGLSLALALVPTLLLAAEKSAKKNRMRDENARSVELFQAMKDGDLTVRLIPKDSKESKITIENKTDKPLNVKLPSSFAGVPVTAQIGGGGTTNRSSNQTTGGSMGGMGGGGMGGGMGMMYIQPEKSEHLTATTVCLEHGKKEPRSAVPYEIKPLDSVTDKPGVKELCEAVGSGKINQHVAQAAAWHLNNDMTWEQLASKRIRHANGTTEQYFNPQEIQAAMEVANAAVQAAEKSAKPSESKTSSSSK